MEKILTIVIPTYNMEKYLDKCLASLIIESKELMRLLEVLVVIDGAKDRSSEIAHTYQDKYPETFRVIDKENGNYGSCVNRGLKEATGKYIKVLDADDSFDTIVFQEYLSTIKNLDVDLVLSDFDYVNEAGAVTGKRRRLLTSDKVLSFDDVVDDLSLISMHELAYKTKSLRSIGYVQTEGISYTDLEWCFMPMTTVKSIYKTNYVLYKYLIGREGQTIDPSVAQKTINHKIISAKKMLINYVKSPQTECGISEYLKSRLLWSISNIYYAMLVDSTTAQLQSLIDFDVFIKENSPSIYKALSEVYVHPTINLKYIKNWQSSKNKLSRPLSVKIFSIFYRKLLCIRKNIFSKK
jgi:glycosyltransferase involved in cell wall biosynthesis